MADDFVDLWELHSFFVEMAALSTKRHLLHFAKDERGVVVRASGNSYRHGSLTRGVG